MHYYQKNIGDYAKKTGHLTALEHGVYNLVMDGYYDRERGPTKIEAERWARARTLEEKAAVTAILEEFFVLVGEEYTHQHIIEEIESYKMKAVIAQENGRKGGRPPKKNQKEPTDNPEVTQPYPTDNPEITGSKANQEPITINQEPSKSKASATGSRLPEDWKPNEVDVEYFRKTCPGKKISTVAENFYDYWIAKPGAGGRKTDWSATWRTWVRREAGSTGPGRPQTNGEDWLKGAI